MFKVGGGMKIYLLLMPLAIIEASKNTVQVNPVQLNMKIDKDGQDNEE